MRGECTLESKSIVDLIRIAIVSIGTAIESLNSEMNGVMWTLIAFISLDYITGVIDSFYHKTLSSKTGFKGILKKVAILCVVAVASIVGIYVFQSDALGTAVTLYYVSNEGISILENCAHIGIPIPRVLKNAIIKAENDLEDTK